MNQISRLRILIDALIQNAFALKFSAETTLAWRSLQMAKGWLGQALKAQGSPTPYFPVSEVSQIPITADVSPDPLFLTGIQLDDINEMRARIKRTIVNVESRKPAEPNQARCFEKSIEHLTEAKMWYGFALAEMRNVPCGTSGTKAPSNATPASLPADFPDPNIEKDFEPSIMPGEEVAGEREIDWSELKERLTKLPDVEGQTKSFAAPIENEAIQDSLKKSRKNK